MISLNNISVNFSGNDLFSDISFVISKKEKIALVGKNGVGKSTLLKLIAGEEQASSGEISYVKDVKIGYLPQIIEVHKEGTLIDICKSVFGDIIAKEKKLEEISKELANREDYDSPEYIELIHLYSKEEERLRLYTDINYIEEIEKTIIGLGFEREDLQRHSSTFSGGWRMRIELAKILLSNPDILLLDEPTNHLDIESINWLENYIKTNNSALLLISHDKFFLDATTTRTIEIENGSIYDYKTNYSHYLDLREERLEQQLRAYNNQEKEIKETEDFIERFRYKATKARQVQSRIKKLEKIKLIDIDNIDNHSINFSFIPAEQSGQYPIIVEELSKNYGQKKVLSNVSLTIERGTKIALVGKNGAGKSTFIKCIMGQINDYTGVIKLGHNVKIGYFAQNQTKELDPNLSIFETIDREAIGDIRTKINDILGAFMFAGETSQKKVSVLSGGEKNRVALIKLLLNPVNVLILDEPTNHLDIRSKNVLKQAIQNFHGTVIIVSHDRYFLEGLVSEVCEFSNGKIKHYLGGVERWLEKKSIEGNSRNITKEELVKGNKEGNIKNTNEGAIDYQKLKEKAKEQRVLQKKIKELEADISEIEKSIKEKEDKLSSNETQPEDFFIEYQSLQKDLKNKMIEWEEYLDKVSQY